MIVLQHILIWLYAQNWLKIKTSYFFLNFDLAKGRMGLQPS